MYLFSSIIISMWRCRICADDRFYRSSPNNKYSDVIFCLSFIDIFFLGLLFWVLISTFCSKENVSCMTLFQYRLTFSCIRKCLLEIVRSSSLSHLGTIYLFFTTAGWVGVFNIYVCCLYYDQWPCIQIWFIHI